MRRLAILVALAACAAEEPGDGSDGGLGPGSSITSVGGEESSSDEGSGSTGEMPTDCLTPGGDPCPASGVCVSASVNGGPTLTGTVCVERCSAMGQCRADTECRVGDAAPRDVMPRADGCYDPCNNWDGTDHCPGEAVCSRDSPSESGVCFWPEE